MHAFVVVFSFVIFQAGLIAVKRGIAFRAVEGDVNVHSARSTGNHDVRALLFWEVQIRDRLKHLDQNFALQFTILNSLWNWAVEWIRASNFTAPNNSDIPPYIGPSGISW